MTKPLSIKYQELPAWIDPETVFETLFAQADVSFWLDSSLINKEAQFSYMGTSSEILSYSVTGNKLTVKSGSKTQIISKDIFTYLNEQLFTRSLQTTNLPFEFAGGYIGYFGYELKALCGGTSTIQSPYADSLWIFVNQFIAFDHQKQKIYLVSLTADKNALDKWFDRLIKKLKHISISIHSEQPKRETHPPVFRFSRNKKQYFKDILTCKKYLAGGESYQICLTNTIKTHAEIDPLRLYLNLRRTNPAPYGAYIKYKDLAILCSSPEQFLKIDKNHFVQTKPIKGTIRRGKTPQEDSELIRQLKTSKKEWSENAMIVDLLRNDLGKVCKFGTLHVSKLMAIETYQTVHQLVSTIRGKLRNEIGIIECIMACFPGGSMTGAPKIRTMEILDKLEKQPRGIYSGALGFLSLDNTAELNIVIRTIIKYKDILSIGTGGAILTDSDPENEFEEMILKAHILRETITNN